jgi:L-fuconolactonase
MKLDSHQHFWSYDEREYPWIPKGTPLHRDWLPDDLRALQLPLGIDGSVAVQARQTLEESRWLLTLADHDPRIKAVVGWVDLRSPEVAEQLGEFAKHPRFHGVRHVVQDEKDPAFMQGVEFRRGIAALREHRLTYDVLIQAKQLPSAIALVREFPDQPFVLDHIAKPLIKVGEIEPWKSEIREIAKYPNLMCKVSGLVTEAAHANSTPAPLRPHLDDIFESFGPERLMWGSDWPVCLLAANYDRAFGVVNEYIAPLPEDQRAAILGGNCARFYGVS